MRTPTRVRNERLRVRAARELIRRLRCPDYWRLGRKELPREERNRMVRAWLILDCAELALLDVIRENSERDPRWHRPRLPAPPWGRPPAARAEGRPPRLLTSHSGGAT
jgi:hypothetical protein